MSLIRCKIVRAAPEFSSPPNVADGVGAEVENARGHSHELELLSRGEWQTSFAIEKLLQPPVAGTAFAPDDFRRDAIAQFAAMTPPFQPIFVADHAINRDARDF